MCLAIPGRIAERYEENGLPMARVDYAGAVAAACLAYTPEAQVGDYVLVHAGFALQLLNEDEAQASLAELARLAQVIELDNMPTDGRDPS
ncbi:MAG: HypC/HybG/HupF family hydrogenase formation chaperone [bacterium]|nr:HypC/HybG/HupF family hydrogenase formation chaperone [bacterium]